MLPTCITGTTKSMLSLALAVCVCFSAFSPGTAFQTAGSTLHPRFIGQRRTASIPQSHRTTSLAPALLWQRKILNRHIALGMQAGDGSDQSGENYSMDSLSFSTDEKPVKVSTPEIEIPAAVSTTPPPPSIQEENMLSMLKLRVLMACSGMDRGAAADSKERKDVLRAVESLESAGMPGVFPEDFDGMWRLVYTSALSPGSGSGGGAGVNSLPIFQTPGTASFRFGPGAQVGQVYQRVCVRLKRLDNIVEINPTLLPLGKTTLTLQHTLEVSPTGRSSTITLSNVAVSGPLPIKIPVAQALSSQGAGVFKTTFLDADVRIARGDRGELRVFVRV